MLRLNRLIYQSILINLLLLYLYKRAISVPIASEAKVENDAPILTESPSENCSDNPCNCCSEKMLSLAEEYSTSNEEKNSECKKFLKNMFCTLACNEESSDIGSVSNEIMVLSVCESGCSEIISKCGNFTNSKNNELGDSKNSSKISDNKSENKIDKEDVDSYKNFNRLIIGASGLSDNSNLKEKKSECSSIHVPKMYISKSKIYSLAFISAGIDTNICLNSLGGFSNIAKVNRTPILKSELKGNNTSNINVSTKESTSVNTDGDGETALTNEELKCGFCFSRCCCWPVWSGAFISFVAYLLMAFLATYWQSALFSLGLKSTHFWKGGGYWLVGTGGFGIFVGMLVGGLVSLCFAGALALGGSLSNLFMSVLLVGRLGAALGGLGGLGTGATIGLMAHSGTISWTVGLVLGLLLGLVVGFSPIARSLKMNDRYIRRGIRQRELRRRSRLSEGYHSENLSDASGTDRGKRVTSNQRHTSTESRDHNSSGNGNNSHVSSSSAVNNAN